MKPEFIPIFTFIILILTTIGIGSILGAFSQSKYQLKKELKNQEFELKKSRYGAIIIQMLTVLQFDKNGLKFVKHHRPDLKSVDDFINEIRTELLNGIVYASDEVIISIANFIKKNDYSTYINAVIEMRKDLWGKKTKINRNIVENIL